MKPHFTHRILAWSLLSSALALLAGTASAQHVTTPAQKALAQRVAQAGVALDELAPNAPNSYTVQSGDTLWAISGLFLKQPWRWPELWGMNLQQVRNPHLIYPGQLLKLDKSEGRAVLRTADNADGTPSVIKVSPRTRFESLADAAIPTLASHLLEPFLAEPMLVDQATHQNAPRFVGSDNERVLFVKGDRVYARAVNSEDLSVAEGSPKRYRVYRNAVPLKDPNTGQVIAYEAQYLGSADIVRGESVRDITTAKGQAAQEIVPATFDIVGNKEEMRIGDRLVPEPARDFPTYAPRAPSQTVEGVRIMSIYGNAVARAGNNTVVSVNKGADDGLEVGHVLAINKEGRLLLDKTTRPAQQVRLPEERIGLAMVFRTFDKVSYALILHATDGVKVGDRLLNP